MATDLTHTELLDKLKTIWTLYQDVERVQAKMNEFTPIDNYERKINVPSFPGEYKSHDERNRWEKLLEHDEQDAVEIMNMAYERVYKPQAPVKPVIGARPQNETTLADEIRKKQGLIPFVAGFIAVCVLLSGGLFSGDALTIILNIAIFIACGFGVFSYFKKYKSAQVADEEATKQLINTYEHTKKEKEEKYIQDVKEYQIRLASYEQTKTEFLNKYIEWREIYLSHLEEEAEIEGKLEADRIAKVNEIYNNEFLPAEEKLEAENDLVSQEYLPVLHIIIDLLKSRRADDLKEAINLYEEIVYRERQLQLQREQEEQRAYEEELRRQDEERRYQEEKAFREQQERQRRNDEIRREREAERRYNEEMKQREMQEFHREQQEKERLRKQELVDARRQREEKDKLWREGSAQCRACANVGHCSMSIHNHAPTCTGFTPRR